MAEESENPPEYVWLIEPVPYVASAWIELIVVVNDVDGVFHVLAWLDWPQNVVPQFAEATLARERVATATAAPLKSRDTIIHLYCYKSAEIAQVSLSLAIRVPNWPLDSCKRRI